MVVHLPGVQEFTSRGVRQESGFHYLVKIPVVPEGKTRKWLSNFSRSDMPVVPSHQEGRQKVVVHYLGVIPVVLSHREG